MTRQQPTFYEILNVDPSATQEEIKKSYTQLVLKHHPDKRKGEGQQTDQVEESDNSIFIAIDEAWKILRDPELRHVYDGELRQSAFNDKPIVHETLTKQDFEYDTESGLYFHNCRCGGIYVLPDDDEDERTEGITEGEGTAATKGSQPNEEVDDDEEDDEAVYIACDECSLVIEVELNNKKEKPRIWIKNWTLFHFIVFFLRWRCCTVGWYQKRTFISEHIITLCCRKCFRNIRWQCFVCSEQLGSSWTCISWPTLNFLEGSNVNGLNKVFKVLNLFL